MFDLSPEKLFVLVCAVLFILGPERLPQQAQQSPAAMALALRRF